MCTSTWPETRAFKTSMLDHGHAIYVLKACVPGLAENYVVGKWALGRGWPTRPSYAVYGYASKNKYWQISGRGDPARLLKQRLVNKNFWFWHSLKNGFLKIYSDGLDEKRVFGWCHSILRQKLHTRSQFQTWPRPKLNSDPSTHSAVRNYLIYIKCVNTLNLKVQQYKESVVVLIDIMKV